MTQSWQASPPGREIGSKILKRIYRVCGIGYCTDYDREIQVQAQLADARENGLSLALANAFCFPPFWYDPGIHGRLRLTAVAQPGQRTIEDLELDCFWNDHRY